VFNKIQVRNSWFRLLTWGHVMVQRFSSFELGSKATEFCCMLTEWAQMLLLLCVNRSSTLAEKHAETP
jgi:hypothetical protein